MFQSTKLRSNRSRGGAKRITKGQVNSFNATPMDFERQQVSYKLFNERFDLPTPLTPIQLETEGTSPILTSSVYHLSTLKIEEKPFSIRKLRVVTDKHMEVFGQDVQTAITIRGDNMSKLALAANYDSSEPAKTPYAAQSELASQKDLKVDQECNTIEIPEQQIMMLYKKEQELGFLNNIVTTMNAPSEIKRSRMISKGGIVKDLRNITQEVKQYQDAILGLKQVMERLHPQQVQMQLDVNSYNINVGNAEGLQGSPLMIERFKFGGMKVQSETIDLTKKDDCLQSYGAPTSMHQQVVYEIDEEQNSTQIKKVFSHANLAIQDSPLKDYEDSLNETAKRQVVEIPQRNQSSHVNKSIEEENNLNLSPRSPKQDTSPFMPVYKINDKVDVKPQLTNRTTPKIERFFHQRNNSVHHQSECGQRIFSVPQNQNFEALDMNKVKLQIAKNEELKTIIDTDFGRGSTKRSKKGSVIGETLYQNQETQQKSIQQLNQLQMHIKYQHPSQLNLMMYNTVSMGKDLEEPKILSSSDHEIINNLQPKRPYLPNQYFKKTLQDRGQRFLKSSHQRLRSENLKSLMHASRDLRSNISTQAIKKQMVDRGPSCHVQLYFTAKTSINDTQTEKLMPSPTAYTPSTAQHFFNNNNNNQSRFGTTQNFTRKSLRSPVADYKEIYRDQSIGPLHQINFKDIETFKKYRKYEELLKLTKASKILRNQEKGVSNQDAIWANSIIKTERKRMSVTAGSQRRQKKVHKEIKLQLPESRFRVEGVQLQSPRSLLNFNQNADLPISEPIVEVLESGQESANEARRNSALPSELKINMVPLYKGSAGTTLDHQTQHYSKNSMDRSEKLLSFLAAREHVFNK